MPQSTTTGVVGWHLNVLELEMELARLTVGEQAQVCFFSDATKNNGWGLEGQ